MSPQKQELAQEPEGAAFAPPQMPPAAQIIQMAGGLVISRAIFVLAELGIADHLKDGARSSEELAKATGTHADSLYRLLRFTSGLGFFVEDENRRFALTPLSAALQSDAPEQTRSTVQMLAGPTAWKGWGEFLHSVQTGETAMQKAFGQSLFDFLDANPDQSALFNGAMIGFTSEEKPAVVSAYDFSSVKTLVDVGGGNGSLLAAILLAHPTMKGILYDLPHPALEARHTFEAKQLTNRCQSIEGNFFDSIPDGGDCYLLSHVLHDWNDGKCLQILRNCRGAMQVGDKLLLVETIMPDGNDFHLAKFMDINMMAFTGGKERTVEEYASLLERTGFRLSEVTQTLDSVIEAEVV